MRGIIPDILHAHYSSFFPFSISAYETGDKVTSSPPPFLSICRLLVSRSNPHPEYQALHHQIFNCQPFPFSLFLPKSPHHQYSSTAQTTVLCIFTFYLACSHSFPPQGQTQSRYKFPSLNALQRYSGYEYGSV